MSEIRPHQEPGISGNPPRRQENSASVSTLGWGLFGRFIFANAGTLFLLAGIICFFAYNWENLSAFAKFGLIAACMLAAAAFTLLRGLDSATGRLGLLACGILGGVLMAVYGQVYQTGANAWELFRSWAVFLIPLTLLGRQAGLWFVLWVVSSLWGIFYLGQHTDILGDDTLQNRLILYQCLAQTGFFILWEAAARFFSGTRFPFLNARWLPRTIGFALLAFLTFVVSLHILKDGKAFGYPVIYTGLYLALIGGGAFYYRAARTDLFMLASGLFSLIVLALTFITRHLQGASHTNILFVTVIVLLAGSALSGKLLIAQYRKRKDSTRQRQSETAVHAQPVVADEPDETPQETPALPSMRSVLALRLALQGKRQDEPVPETVDMPDKTDDTAEKVPWQARLLMGVCAWIAVPCLIILVFLLFSSAFGTSGYSILFLILLAAGIALSYLRGVFFEQAALVLCLTGAIAASALIGSEMENSRLFLMPAIAIFSLSAFSVKNKAYRFLATAFAITLVFFQADLVFYPVEQSFGMKSEISAFSPYGAVIFALIYSACGVMLAHFWRKFTQTGIFALQHHPFIAALFATPLFLGIFSVLFHSGTILRFLAQATGLSGFSIRTAGIGAAAGLGYLVFRLAKDLDMRPLTCVIMALLSVPVAVVSWYIPWFGIGLLILALSRQAGSMVLLGTATLFLAGCTILEYYALSSTLLVKSFSLGGIGVILLLFSVGLHYTMTWRLRKGWLHVPSSLISASHPKMQASPTSAVRTTAVMLPERLARVLLAACVLVFLLVFSYSVRQKEHLLENGERVILALRPVDPRSLMQGDYMILALEIEDAIYTELYAASSPEKYFKGTIVAAPDGNGVFRFVRFDDGAPLEASQVRLLYRGKRSGVRVGSGSFFFQEGYGKPLEKARFVELRTNENGETLFTHLLDENRQRINPKQLLAEKPDRSE